MAKRRTPFSFNNPERDADGDQELGFGKHVLTEGRLMNPDGSFNVQRNTGLVINDVYFSLIRMSWPTFWLTIGLAYFFINVLFAIGYMCIGGGQFTGVELYGGHIDFADAFFFSTQTMTTVGYGRINPIGVEANFLASFEMLVGLLSFALMSGLLFGRFSRPTAKILFSDNLLISPYREGKGLMLRMMNARRSELMQVQAKIIVAINQADENGQFFRRFHTLKLELDYITFFSLSWTLVHGLDENSPVYGLEKADFENGNVEFMVLIQGTDESTEQIVTARRSYVAEEMVWGAKFAPLMKRDAKGNTYVYSEQLGEYEKVQEV